MVKDMMENIKTITSMGKVYSHGQVVQDMKVNLKTIIIMDLVFSHIQMVIDIKENGKTIRSMEIGPHPEERNESAPTRL